MLILVILIQLCMINCVYYLGKQRGMKEAKQILWAAYQEGQLKGIFEALEEAERKEN